MIESVDVAVIGGGQAGLATSWYLTQAGADHVVFEAGRVAETWRSRRWDSFCLVTPNWAVKLPGAAYAGPEPDGFMLLAQLIAFFESWAESFQPPVMQNTHVSRLEADSRGHFMLSLGDRQVRARSVVVASGFYHKAHRPAGAETLPATLHQVLAEDYGSPAKLPPGNVLIIGSGQTGCQLAEELHEAGRKVFIACGRCPWAQRRIGGRDFIWWFRESGYNDRTPDQLPSPAARLVGNPQATGHEGGHDLNYRTLHQMGVELLGRFLGAEGSTLHFADDLAASVDFGDARWADIRGHIDAWCTRTGTPRPIYDLPPPMRIPTRTELDLAREGITNVIWTSGYRPEYGWVEFPVFDDMGFPIQTDGATSVPGLYFVGVHWMRKFKSAILAGVGEDAEIVARQIVESRK
ncbi:MAG TPA: FAD-dependent oxidoreductase [Chloroflexi bacterium]|jgi:putative flavoprotein involved in K+ transport|nr:FAD-dependent oxidoreductase [Chloroflexota bacterium]HAF18168.1 FAD-dependent oxidoreductase [Chloroflexota bacterium]